MGYLKSKIIRYIFNKISTRSYKENYKNLVNKIKEPNKWRNILYSWVRRLNILKKSVLLILIYRFSTIQIRIPVS